MSSLLDEIKQGNTQAVVTFYQEYSPQITAYVRRKLPREEDVQELINDVFLDAIDGLSLLRKQEHVRAWLYKIAHNKIVDFYRKRKVTSFLLSQLPFLEIVAEEITEPEFQYEKDKLRDKIELTLHSISKKNQRILRLHYEENRSVKEIATIIHLSPKATESLLFRARKSFQLAYERT